MRQKRDAAVDLLVIRSAAAIGVAACLGDLYMTHFLGARFPGYNPFLQAMSDLGHAGSPVEAIASTWWVIMGLMFMVFAYGFYRAFRDEGRRAKTAAWMLALYGIGEGLGSGLVRGSPGRSFQTPGSIIHNLLGGVGVAAAILLPFLIMKIYGGRRSSAIFWYSWICTAGGVFSFILFSIATFYHPEGSWISWAGLWQRLFMLAYYLFFIGVALLMLIRPK